MVHVFIRTHASRDGTNWFTEILQFFILPAPS